MCRAAHALRGETGAVAVEVVVGVVAVVADGLVAVDLSVVTTAAVAAIALQMLWLGIV